MSADDLDDVVLQRSWPDQYDRVVRRGRRLRRRRRMFALAPVVAAVAVVAVVAGLALSARSDGEAVRTVGAPSAGEPVLRQRVAFVRVIDGGRGGTELFVTDADGSHLRPLSTDAGLRDGAPAFSPDGAWIAFQSERDNPQRAVRRVTDLYVMRPDGTGVRRLTTTSDPGRGNGVRHPAWSPDSTWLAAAAEDADDVSRIVLLHPDGTGAHAITGGAGDVGPVWSPDGAWIAFRRRPPGGDEELWVVRPDGTGGRRVVPRIHDGPVAWTPDGSRLTYAGDLPGGRTRLFTVALDGSGRRRVTFGPGIDDLEPAWSADGRLLVYSDDPDGEYLVDAEVGGSTTITGGRRPGCLVVTVPGGGAPRVLTSPEAGDQDRSPSLGPPPEPDQARPSSARR
jgi:Tol biopolymer transport system component